MCDPGENISVTLKREFMEEATDCLGQNESARSEIENHLDEFFKGGEEIYKGYVDDPRNTDNAWMKPLFITFMMSTIKCLVSLNYRQVSETMSFDFLFKSF